MSVLEARLLWSADGFSLDVDARFGEGVTALFGASGAGKSTLLRGIVGLLDGAEGSISSGGDTLFDSSRGVNVPPERRRIGIVFQDLRLFPHLTVEGNLRYGHALRESSRPAWDEVVPLLELEPLLHRRPGSLSGGEARRVALGRALLASPRLLLLDEPLTGLDDARKGVVLALLNRVHSALGVPMVLVSHSLSDLLEAHDLVRGARRRTGARSG